MDNVLQTKGIHHITAIVGNAQENIDFYAGVLGLRLVKKTVNFDDPETYHFYFGDEIGTPGTIITFFPWDGAPHGRIGNGQVGITTYRIPKGSIEFWQQRLHDYGIETTRMTRFNETYLQFKDIHGLKLELVEQEDGPLNKWEFNGITKDVAIKGFHGAVLYSSNIEKTSTTLTHIFGLEKIAEDKDYIRFQADGPLGNIIDLTSTDNQGKMGVGTVHHIAWRTSNNEQQIKWQEHVKKHGFFITDIYDRNYFNATYFRENGHILFEIATDPPGFLTDESFKNLGETLQLPAQLEHNRSQLEQLLPDVTVRHVKPFNKGE